MGIGSRIFQKRKEKGLSQEKLGERLNVSRQTVYKWENDQSTPEIANLIAMAEIFDVPVGWLINGEDTKEVIVEKETVKDNRKAKVFTGILIGAAFLYLLAAIHSLKQESENLQNQLDSLNYRINGEIASISDRVQETLNHQQSLTISEECTITDINPEEQTVSFHVSVHPKTYRPDMKTLIHVRCEDERLSFETTEDQNVFGCALTVPLTEELTQISAEFVYEDGSETTLISEYNNLLGQTFPDFDIVWPVELSMNSDRTGFDDDIFLLHRYGPKQISIFGYDDFTLPEIVSMEAGLYMDGEKIADYTYRKPDQTMEEEGSHIEFLRPDDIVLDPEKTYQERAVITDEIGRKMILYCEGYEFRTEYRIPEY
ncbi:MAG: helix-turn-helix domain-containing protein [Bulleidia sp.]